MKYLKLYESFTQPNISNMMSVMAGFKKVRDFCDEYLAFLKDEGFKVEIGRGDNNSEIIIKILKPQYHESLNHINYNWSEVRDDVIPFYQILKEKFNVVVANAVTNYAKSASEIPSGIKLDGLIDDLSDKIIHYVYIKVNLDTNIKESHEVMDFDKMYNTVAEQLFIDISDEFIGRFFPLKIILDELDGHYNMSICLAMGWMDRINDKEQDWLDELIKDMKDQFSEYNNIYIGYMGDSFSLRRKIYEKQNDAFPKKSDDYLEFPKSPNPGRGNLY